MKTAAIIIVFVAIGLIGIALACASGKAIERGDKLGSRRDQK